MKYPIGIETFREIIESGYVYVDKTAQVYRLATEGKVYFLSRPRRFGKSLLISTLESYFLGEKELFKGLKIDSLEKDWIEYPVFTISFSKGIFTNEGELEKTLFTTIAEWERKYESNPDATTLSDRFYYVLKAVYEKTGRRTVVLIDEYDKPLLDVIGMEDCMTTLNGKEITMEEYNRNILKGFYGVFKAADRYLKFVMLTGVTKFSQVSVFSGFNQPKDISMDPRYEAICGITKDEMLTVFDEPIHELAEEMGWSYDETVAELKKHYDGYHFGKKMTDIFNPFSLINCFDSLDINGYWFSTATPTYFMRLVSKSKMDIRQYLGRYYMASEFEDYRADDQKPVPMLYQSGYLTIKDYKRDMKTYRLDFPNEEVRQGYITMLVADYFSECDDRNAWIENVRNALYAGEVEEFVNLMTALFASTPYWMLRKNDKKECERFFQYGVYLTLQMILAYAVIPEKNTSEGRADCVIECPNFLYIIEFKLNDSAENALQQIKDKGYVKTYAADKRKVFLLGIKFSSETGTIEDFQVVEGLSAVESF